MRKRTWVLAVLFLLPDLSRAAIPRAGTALSGRLSGIRGRVLDLERELIDGARVQAAARFQLKRIKALLELQKQERELSEQRIVELEKTISELEVRRGALLERIRTEQRRIRGALAEIGRSLSEEPRSIHLAERERLEAPRRKVLGNLVDRGLKEIEALRVDMADADKLEAQIGEEKLQLANLLQDIQEQEGILALSQQLQSDLLEKKHAERLSQLENYRRLKSSESEVERLIGEFNARRELEKSVEAERTASRAMTKGLFQTLKGKLPYPVFGKVVSGFGRSFDDRSGLHVFKKGVEINGGKSQPVQAVSAGRVAFAGELPDYGRVVIVDHGEHFYSLCARLGGITKKEGDAVVAGDPLGTTDGTGTPVYFEIRARNVAVNPLQWLSD